MKNRMRHIAVAAAALVVSHVGTAETVRAQGADAWPQKTVTLVVPFAAASRKNAPRLRTGTNQTEREDRGSETTRERKRRVAIVVS